MIKKIWKKFIERQNKFLFGSTHQTITELNLELLEKIKNLKNKTKNPKLKPTKTLTLNQISKLLKGLPVISYSDKKSNTCPVNEMRRFILELGLHKRKYTYDDWDCENFALATLGEIQKRGSFYFGLVRGGADGKQDHLFNIFIDEEKQVWIVEPQTATFYTLDSIKKNKLYWPFRFVMI